MKHFAIIGAGGHGRSLLHFFENGRFLLGYLDDNKIEAIGEYPILGTVSNFVAFCTNLDEQSNFASINAVVIGIGENKFRTQIFNRIPKQYLPLLVHHQAVVSKNAKIGKGTVIFPGVIINPFAQIGDNCIVNTGAIIEHDAIIKDNSNIAPNAKIMGNALVEEFCFVGSGAIIREGITIGKHSVVGMGAIVTKSIPSYALVIGNPAKIIRKITADYLVFSANH